MSEETRTAEDVHQFLAELDRTQPVGSPHELRERDYQRRKEQRERERERQAREARKAEEKQQHAVVKKQQVATTDWYDAVDTRIRTHFKDWAWAAIDERIREHIEIAQKPLVEATGDVFGQFRERLRAEFRHGIEELTDAFGAQIAALEQRLASNDQAARAAQGRAQHDEFKRVIEEAQRSLETKLAALEERLRAVPGKLPVAKTWCEESVIYAGEVVSHDGASYQALRDTAQMPGGSDWACIARAGVDGRTPKFCGAFNAHKKYRRLDVIEFDGSSFIALHDDPGIPGDPGWQILSKNGSRGPAGNVGPQGQRGVRGARGETPPTIIRWTLDRAHLFCRANAEQWHARCRARAARIVRAVYPGNKLHGGSQHVS